MKRASKIVATGLLLIVALGGCTHQVRVTSPERPIQIEVLVRCSRRS